MMMLPVPNARIQRPFLAAAVALLLLATALQAEGKILWKSSLGATGVHHRPTAIALLPDGTIVAAGAVSAEEEGETPAIWLLDANGSPKKQLAILGGRTDVRIRDVHVADGFIVALVTGRDGVYLTAVDRDGNEIFSRLVGTTGELAEAIIPITGGYLLAGRTEQDALLIAVGADGAPRWKRTYDRGQRDAFTDGFATSEGTLLAGQSGEYRSVFAGDAWLVVVDERGHVVRERQWKGRDLRVAPIDDRSFAAVYDRAFEFKQDVAVSLMKADLTPAWTTPIAREQTYRNAFHITAGRGFINVAGSGAINARLWRLDSQGRVVWSWAETPSETASWHLRADDLMTAGGATYVLTTIYDSKGDGMPAWRVGVVRTQQER